METLTPAIKYSGLEMTWPFCSLLIGQNKLHCPHQGTCSANVYRTESVASTWLTSFMTKS